MDAARHDHICGIFEQAIALPEEQRAALLERSCAGDASLRAEVDSLIAAHQRTNPMLDAGALALLTQPEDDEHPDLTGQRIGRYELKRVIARGGMGIVYEAMQEQPRRTVAVKVLRRLGSPSAVRRFHEEAQILARLSHPHIAHVYEAGTHIDGSSRGDNEHLPFFAMEYISGARPLTEFTVERRLPIRERLLLFIRVCEAVQHGHQKGIIHRDLKPANILVNADGVLKVIDFGVARVLDFDGESRTRHTLAGRVIGTLPYCSPEQIDENAGDIDSRSDVYALGTVLYELLAGVPAFKTDGRSTWQTMTMIRESSPQPLRDRDRALRGNLDAIVSRAMEKNPDRRYQSVESLRRDIERHLAGEPIEARPQSRWIGATRWMARHPMITTGISAAVLAAVILLVSLAAVAYGLRQPARFVSSPDGDAAFLVTVFGRPLATLGGQGAGKDTVQAQLVDRADAMGGGRVALFNVARGEHSTDHQLWICTPGNLSEPLWRTSAFLPSSMPELPSQWNLTERSTGFVAGRFEVADVFPELPGEEFILIEEQQGHSPNAIRVYALNGEVLYEAWHWGHVAAIHWWRDVGLIVCAGDRHGRRDVERFDYTGTLWPKVVFAVRPTLGQQIRRWLNEPGWPKEWRSSTTTGNGPEWYRVLGPKELAGLYGPTKIHVQPAARAESQTIAVTFDSTTFGAFALVINERGEFVALNDTDQFFRDKTRSQLATPTLTDWPPEAEDN